MSILDNLKAAEQAIGRDIANGSPRGLAKKIGEAAIEAITHGLLSPQGQRYMALFCDNANELAQMTVVRVTDENYMPQVRAYVPANAVCQIDTNTQLTNGVRERIIEPPVGAQVPAGTADPALIRDVNLFQLLRQP